MTEGSLSVTPQGIYLFLPTAKAQLELPPNGHNEPYPAPTPGAPFPLSTGGTTSLLSLRTGGTTSVGSLRVSAGRRLPFSPCRVASALRASAAEGGKGGCLPLCHSQREDGPMERGGAVG